MDWDIKKREESPLTMSSCVPAGSSRFLCFACFVLELFPDSMDEFLFSVGGSERQCLCLKLKGIRQWCPIISILTDLLAAKW